jgi:hypothetical protein
MSQLAASPTCPFDSMCPARGAAPPARLRASSTHYAVHRRCGTPVTWPPQKEARNRGPGSAAHHIAPLVLRSARESATYGFAIAGGCSTKTIALICWEGGGDRTATIALHGGHSNVRILVPFRRG